MFNYWLFNVNAWKNLIWCCIIPFFIATNLLDRSRWYSVISLNFCNLWESMNKIMFQTLIMKSHKSFSWIVFLYKLQSTVRIMSIFVWRVIYKLFLTDYLCSFHFWSNTSICTFSQLCNYVIYLFYKHYIHHNDHVNYNFIKGP